MSTARAIDAPRFSVIIPAYNAAATLARAIDSVLAQTWTAHEVIVVDDGSHDASAALAAAYGPPVRLLRQANAGVSAARNAGAQAATGDWLTFLDADDWYYPERLQWHGEWLLEAPGLDFLTGDYDYRRPDGSLIGTSMAAHPAGRALLAQAAGAARVVMPAAQFEPFVAEHFGDTHTLSVPRATFLALGGYPTGYRVCEDVFFLVKLCAASRAAGVVCRALAAYVIHPGSATRQDPLRAQFDNVRTLVHLARAARRFPPPIRRGVRARLAAGRLDLGYALAKAGRRGAACRALLPALWQRPGLASVKALLSVARG